MKPSLSTPLPAPAQLFFALWPPEPVREALVALQAGLPRPAGRCNHRLDLHLTLVFVGTVASELRPCVEAAGDGLVLPPFELSLTECSYWPRPRIRRCRPGQMPAGLPVLVEAIRGRLRDCGVSLEERPYEPHVTLARKAGPLPDAPLPAPILWPVDSFVLATSGTGHRPAYQIVRRWPLAPSPKPLAA